MAVMPVRRLLLHMSWPMMLSMLIQALYNMVDSVFVAQLSGAGFEALSLVYPIQTLMIAVCVGTGVGVNAMIARRLGEKRSEEAGRVAVHGYFLYLMTWLAFAGVSLTLLRGYMGLFTSDPDTLRYGMQYLTIVTVGSLGKCGQFAGERVLQASGDAVGPMIIQGLGAVINLVLDPLLIFGIGPFPRLEVVGAALATVIGQLVGMAVGLVLVRRNPVIHLRVKGFRPSGAIVRDIYRIGAPAVVMQALTTVMSMGMNKLLALITRHGVFILGAYFRLQSFIFMPIFGLNNALIPVVSFNYGAKSRSRVSGLIRFALTLTVGIMAAGTLVLLLLPGPLLGFFDAAPAVMAEGIPALRLVALSFVFAGVSIILCSAMQAVGAPVCNLAVSLLRQAVFLLPAAALLGWNSPPLVWLSFLLAEAGSCGIALLLYRRVSRVKYAGLKESTT